MYEPPPPPSFNNEELLNVYSHLGKYYVSFIDKVSSISISLYSHINRNMIDYNTPEMM